MFSPLNLGVREDRREVSAWTWVLHISSTSGFILYKSIWNLHKNTTPLAISMESQARGKKWSSYLTPVSNHPVCGAAAGGDLLIIGSI